MSVTAFPPNCYVQQNFNIPLVPIQLDEKGPTIWCKLEYLNPSGSTKDRIANFILGKAVRSGKLKKGGYVVEASSGSTSISMALVCAQYCLNFIAVMPEGVSNERSMIIRSYGGEVVFSPKDEGVLGSIRVAQEIADKKSAFLPRQFSNLENPASHRRQTAIEILKEIPSNRVDAVVSGVGTGGTLVGLYSGFVDFGCAVKPVAAKPMTGKALADMECCSFSSRIPGVVDGLSEIYSNADLPGLVELEVDDDLALEATRRIIKKGFPVGPSSGLNYVAACQVAEELGPGANVVTVFADRMERYFSTELFRELAAERAPVF
ncbi:MAG: cysteine synthase family protein [Pirellulaceae bacterium]|nr:cysteine synthase family protein [Pirellulaceae bacterium]